MNRKMLNGLNLYVDFHAIIHPRYPQESIEETFERSDFLVKSVYKGGI